MAKAGADVYCGDIEPNDENDELFAEPVFLRPCVAVGPMWWDLWNKLFPPQAIWIFLVNSMAWA